MKKLCLVLISVIITSCSMPVTFTLFNNSGIDQVIILKDKLIRVRDGNSEDINGVEYSEFSIRSKQHEYAYSVEDIPLSNVVWRGWGPFSKRVFHAQLESDGKIWATTSKERAVKFREQPEGFPLVPDT